VFAAREALALGVAVLASRVGALAKLVRDGKNGFTFDPGAPAELAGLLRRLTISSRSCEKDVPAERKASPRRRNQIYKDDPREELRAPVTRAELERLDYDVLQRARLTRSSPLLIQEQAPRPTVIPTF